VVGRRFIMVDRLLPQGLGRSHGERELEICLPSTGSATIQIPSLDPDTIVVVCEFGSVEG
jgi:hypothetical protein